MTTKTVVFEGKQYEVPEWVEWITRDSDWCLCGFERKPYDGVEGFCSGGRHYAIRLESWRDSLTKV